MLLLLLLLLSCNIAMTLEHSSLGKVFECSQQQIADELLSIEKAQKITFVSLTHNHSDTCASPRLRKSLVFMAIIFVAHQQLLSIAS